MVCPKCQNRKWQPLDKFRNPLKNLGYKEHFKTFNLRRYVCLECGHKFVTKEEYYRDIQVRDQQPSLFGGDDE